jgi:hypothetical protein
VSALSLVIRILMTLVMVFGVLATMVNLGSGKTKTEVGCLSTILNLLLIAGVWLI